MKVVKKIFRRVSTMIQIVFWITLKRAVIAFGKFADRMLQIVLFALLFALPIQTAYNYAIAAVFNLPMVGFWEAFFFFMLVKIFIA